MDEVESERRGEEPEARTGGEAWDTNDPKGVSGFEAA